jgi:hypothetical protein
MNDNNYRSLIQMNNWTMRNNYQNGIRKSINKTRHNSISKRNRFFFISKKKRKF